MGLTVKETSEPENPVLEARTSRLVMLPSHLFFVRALRLPAGIGADEIPSFVEVALEQISPFTLGQLYYGYFQPPESEDLLMYAAYRKQLAVYEDEEWTEAEQVLPEFASVLGLEREGPTLVFLQDRYEVTAVYWPEGSTVPERVLSRAAESTVDGDGESGLEKVREDLRRKIGPLPGEVKTRLFERTGDGGIREKKLVFQLREDGAETISTEIPRSVYLAMDVRDKAFLVAVRKERRQNRLLWGGVLLLLAGFVAMGVLEGALYAGGKIVEKREERVLALKPEVARIMDQEELANRLEELGGERLLPFEMLGFLNQLRPNSVYFTTVVTDGLRGFRVDASTPRSQDVDRYQRLLEQAEELTRVEVLGLRTRPDGHTAFSVAGIFRENVLNQDSRTASGSVRQEAPSRTSSSVDERAVEERLSREDARPQGRSREGSEI